jgi:phytoene dehydrogenase-like protein
LESPLTVAAPRDVVIIGGGHNALVTAFYLARAGFKPLVLERRPVVGGAAITDEFHPGFRCPTLAHTVGPLAPHVARDMRLERDGLAILHPEPRLFAPAPDGRALLLFTDPSRSAIQISRFSKRDAQQYVEFDRMLARMSAAISGLLNATPPSVDDPSTGELWELIKVGRKVRGLGKKDMFRLLRYGPMAVADLVGEWFETEPLRAVIAARGIFGTFLGPWSAGTSAVLLLRAAADAHPAGTASLPRGGMGVLTQALAAAAQHAGAEIRTGADVVAVSVKDGATAGVVLGSGEEIAARAVVSGADPRHTLLKLVDPVHLEPGFVVKMRHFRAVGTTAKVNLALAGLPRFTAVSDAGMDERAALAGRIHIGPEIDYLERAFDAAKYGRFSAEPYLDVTIPSVADPSLAPAGRHVMSIYMQYAPYNLRDAGWREQRDALADAVVKTLAAYVPDLPGLILHRQVITPLDLEQTYGLTGGHIFHGELALDQLFTMRPLLDLARYATPIRGLYLCGSGTHPGNGLTGLCGSNAARAILASLRR